MYFYFYFYYSTLDLALAVLFSLSMVYLVEPGVSHSHQVSMLLNPRRTQSLRQQTEVADVTVYLYGHKEKRLAGGSLARAPSMVQLVKLSLALCVTIVACPSRNSPVVQKMLDSVVQSSSLKNYLKRESCKKA